MPALTSPIAPLSSRAQNLGNIFLALSVVVVISLLVIPIPFWMLDALIAINVMLSLAILLNVMYINKPIEFTSFPTLLLITTVFRLSINVSSARLILSYHPDDFDVHIIEAFGNFVMGGNLLVGVIVFLIIIAVQFIVITKGSVRISEVAARFTLDSVPTRNLAIESEVNSGLISREEAERRRKEIRAETDFYGAMDGASKFVQGDVRVALLIVIINLVGGVIVGTLQHDLSLSEAFERYGILAIGEGLVAQIPALMLATGTGIIVTRATDNQPMAAEIYQQLLLKPLALIVVGSMIAASSLITGFPWPITLIVGGIIAGLGFYLQNYIKNQTEIHEKNVPQGPLETASLVSVEPMELEIGFNIIPFVDEKEGGKLLEKIRYIRRQSALELGLVVPSIRVRDNMRLKPSGYAIRIQGVLVGQGHLHVKNLLAIPSSPDINIDTSDVPGEITKEPVYQSPAKWIREEDKNQAELNGYNVVDPPTIITTHLTELIRNHAPELMTLQSVRQLLDHVKQSYPAVTDAISDAQVQPTMVLNILQKLLKERVSIRNMVRILEVLVEHAPRKPSVDDMAEIIRTQLGRQICLSLSDENKQLEAIVLDPQIDQGIAQSVESTPEHGLSSRLSPQDQRTIIDAISETLAKVRFSNHYHVIICSQQSRPILSNLIQRAQKELSVISYAEITPDVQVKQLAIVSAPKQASVNA